MKTLHRRQSDSQRVYIKIHNFGFENFYFRYRDEREKSFNYTQDVR